MKHKYVYLKMEKNAVFYRYMRNCNIKNYYIFQKNNIIFKVLRKLRILEKRFFLGFWKFRIKDYKYVILGENGHSKEITKYIKKKNPKCKTIMYFWNILNDEYKKILDDNNIDEFWTFDKQDATNYGLKYNPQFYTNDIKLKENNLLKDIVFLGRAKDRKEKLILLEEKLQQNGATTNFLIIDKEKDIISYDKYLDLVSKSRCILDYNQEGQAGLTLRPMEALFLKKKLITNNKDIVNYDFYNSNNIFVLGLDDIGKLDEFIKGKYEEIDTKFIEYYDFKSWLKRFGI